jgi:hypothetical protein
MYDPIQVVRQLRKRWQEAYGEELAIDDIRRKLGRLLEEVQDREFRSVFSGWQGADLSKAIDTLFDYSDQDEAAAPTTTILADSTHQETPPVAPAPPLTADDTEYLPQVDRAAAELIAAVQVCPTTCPTCPTKRKGGRPPGAKNKPK